jgi:hypothetical protein
VVNLSNLATQRPDAAYDVEDEELLAAAQDFLRRHAELFVQTTAAARPS